MRPSNPSFPEPKFGIVVEHPAWSGVRYLVLGSAPNGHALALMISDGPALGTSRRQPSPRPELAGPCSISWSPNDLWIIRDEGIER